MTTLADNRVSIDSALIIAGCPIKNRSWIAKRHVKALLAQTRKPDALLYLVNDDDGQTLPALVGASDGTDLHLGIFNTGDDGSDRLGNRYSIENLARVRNEFVESFLQRFPQATHLWSCDSDVLPDPDVLELLLDADIGIAAAVVRNSDAPVWNFMCGWSFEASYPGVPQRNGEEAKYVALASKRPHYATLVGACVLIQREVLENGVRYSAASTGEDQGFCDGAFPHYFPGIVTAARTRHVQRDGTEWR